MTWLEVLYITSNGFDGNNDYKDSLKISDLLSSANDNSRIDIIKDWLARRNMYDDSHINNMRDSFSADLSDIDKIYDAIIKENLQIDTDNYGIFSSIIANMIASGGKFISKKGWQGSAEPIDEDDMQKFADDFRNLTNGAHSLDKLIRFVYENNLTNITQENITGKKPDDEKNTIYERLYANTVPLVKTLVHYRQFKNQVKINLYEMIGKTYQNDVEFITAVSDLVSQYLNVKMDKSNLKQKIDIIMKNYPDEEQIAYEWLDDILDSKPFIKKQSKPLDSILSKAKLSDYSLRLAMKEYIGFSHGSSKIISTEDEADTFETEIDKLLEMVIGQYVNIINDIDKGITELDSFVQTPFYINNKLKMNLLTIVPLWQDFISSTAYQYRGKKVDDDIKQRCENLINTNKYVVSYKGKDEAVLNMKTATIMMDVLQKIVIDRPDGRYDSIIPFVATKFAKYDLPVSVKIRVQKTMLQYLKDFFEIPFKNKIEMSAGEKMNMMFDAVCNLVYYKNKNIAESRVYEGLFYGSFAIMESESKKKYFDKLGQSMKAYYDKHKTDNPVDYVNDKETVLDIPDSNENSDKSDEKNPDNSNLNQELINKLANDAELLKQTVASQDGVTQN